MQQIKGSVLKSRLAFVVDHSGIEGRERVLQALHEDDRRALNSILTVKWYPLDLGSRLDDAIVRTLGDGKSAFFEKLGAASADKNLGSVHKAFLPASARALRGRNSDRRGGRVQGPRRQCVPVSPLLGLSWAALATPVRDGS